MAGSSPQLSSTALELLHRVREEGGTSALLKELALEQEGFEFVHEEIEQEHGAMTDAPKRRLTEGPIPSESPALTRQMPIPKTSAKGAQSHGYEHPLPAGVTSMEMWGRTIIDYGKLAKRGITYEELATSVDSELLNYQRWLRSQKGRENFSPLMKDLINYLLRFQAEHEGSASSYPDSSVPRRLKGSS